MLWLGTWASACFFFQAEDGIRDGHVTGVQTCALPILAWHVPAWMPRVGLLGGAAAMAMLFTGLMYLVAAMRYRTLLVEAPDASSKRAARAGILKLLAPDSAPRQRAVLLFIATVLGRSRVHRMVVAG